MTPPSQPSAAQPKVFTMPEKFRSVTPGPTGGGRKTKRLLIILIVVLVLAGLGVAGLYVFQNVFNQPANDNTNGSVVNQNRNQNFNTNSPANGNINGNANGNANGNVNGATNGNLNVNGNANANANTNAANANTNANANGNANTNTPRLTPLPSSADGDRDGLTDIEEVVYGTDSSKPDSDQDSFIDGKQERSDGTVIGEVYNGYNPKGSGRLEDSTLVKRQLNGTNTYSLLIPSTWTGVQDQSGGILINPSQATGEFFQVRIHDNATRQTPEAWYQSANPNANVNSLKTITFGGFEGIYSEDESAVYLFRDTKVYSLQYTTGSLTQVNYWTTFEMMVRSFKLVAATS